ncbi:MAG TPA: hypothetical protein DFR83_29310, partial [Deltaproteobacteria bacterium]|nr:hypothetical protein [Deltaproteobacteria bacterium]
MADQPWNIAGPLPSADSGEEAAFRRAVRRIYTQVDHTEALVPQVEALLERLDRHRNAPLWAFVQRCLATRSTILADYAAAEPRIAQALAVVDAANDPREYFNLLNLWGLIYKFTGEFAQSVATHSAILLTVRKNNLLAHGMVSATNLAYVLMEMGSPALANQMLIQSTDLLEHTTGTGAEQYWTARLSCADSLRDREGARKACLALIAAQAENQRREIPNDPSGLAAVRTLGPMAVLPLKASKSELLDAGAHLFEAATRETRFMPGYRLKAAVDCASIALQLDQPTLALQLVDLGRSIRPDDLPVQWATQLEELAAQVHEAHGDFQQALIAERRARAYEREKHVVSIQSTTRALLNHVLELSSGPLRAIELEQVNHALRDTKRRMKAALGAADEGRGHAEQAAGARHQFLSRMSHELRTPLQG